ncbi:Protein of unknown function (DUF3037) [Streptoalloteichus tenebrarius]|uniref:DUF3037 domain-containing protein n=1 Tax=Streptoalloteichus tenebrarius (strain ATCC 17920 / DSM 40477 / JCM 4838 / CBS 697.72 / NBRC 16177 / NCIMB 11028 / NRRL B-12390 / A12253. 1 / ISP 5477) TaxID=1933 RepID=A0ABT1HU72_STRSD|nr:DUF3037 domain-containing protein [Streptoalloteichus tenebrarius]MCP2259076.1 Protein of unknown function (DUF3037) [Streptoalloteichus tenebrarius]BFE99598.1 DUF3037 domain-containing protein [Streptoalloteichus tenebrarius]
MSVNQQGRPEGRRSPFEYAVIQLVPRIERNERINVGVLLYCQAGDFLAARTHLVPDRVRALDSTVDVDAVRAALDAVERTCVGGEGGGPAGSHMTPGQRFRWLTAPRSTILQAGPVHTGLTADPEAELERLLDVLVR